MTKLMEQPSCSTGSVKLVTPYDLRIGVAGHRHLAESKSPMIETGVREMLDQIEHVLEQTTARPQAYPVTKPATLPQWCSWLGERIDVGLAAALKLVWPMVPANPQIVPADCQTRFRWVVVSPLAKGSDRIVARAVMEWKNPHAGPLPPEAEDGFVPRLEVVLPMAREQYREDFKDSQDRQEFDELFAKASWTNEADQFMPKDVAQVQSRNLAYRLAGHGVINRCDVLVAIWDGKPAKGASGTGEIVPYAIQQGRPVLWINSEQPDAPVLLLTKTPSPSAKPFPTTNGHSSMAGVYIDEFPKRGKQISLGFHRLAAFQRDPALDSPRFAAELEKAQRKLEEELSSFGLYEAAKKIGQIILPSMVRADMLAERYQLLHRRSVILIYSLALLAVTVAVVQQVFWPEHHWIGILEVLALLAAWGLLRVNRRERWQEKYLNDRYLAEWLRRAQFEVLMPPVSGSESPGLSKKRHPISAAAPAVGQVELYHGPETWFVDAFQQLIDRAPQEIHCEGDAATSAFALPTLRAALLKAWIEPQADWHSQKAENTHRKARCVHRTTFCLFLATLLFAAAHLLFGHMMHDPIGRFVASLAIVLPAAAATMHAIERFFHHERNADRSQQMARQLHRLADRLRAAETNDELRQAIREVDALMAREVEEWWIAGNLHRPGHPV